MTRSERFAKGFVGLLLGGFAIWCWLKAVPAYPMIFGMGAMYFFYRAAET